MKKTLIVRSFIVAVVLVACFATALGDRRAKARHFYIKGAIAEAMERPAEAYELYKKAYYTDTTYMEAAYAFGYKRMDIMNALLVTPEERLRSLALMKPLTEAYPMDAEIQEKYMISSMMSDTIPEALRVLERLIANKPGLSRVYLPYASLQSSLGNYAEAFDALTEYERIEGPDSDVTMQMASLKIIQGDTLGSVDVFRRAVDLQPDELGPMLDLAMVYGVLNFNDSASMTLKEAQKRFPDSGEVKFERAMLELKLGNTDSFHRLIEETLNSDLADEDRSEVFRQYIEALPTEGNDFSESDRIIGKYLGDDVLQSGWLLSQYYNKKNDYVKALETEEKNLRENPEDSQTLGRLMSFALYAERPEEAIKAFEEFSDESEKRNYFQSMLYISAAKEARQFEKALAWCDTLINSQMPEYDIKSVILPPDTVDETFPYEKILTSMYFEAAADIYQTKGDNEDATRCFENALILDGTNFSAMNNYAFFIVENEKARPGTEAFEKAREMSRRTLQNENGSEAPFYYYDTYAWILFRDQEYKEALDVQEIAVEMADPQPIAEILSHYGDILFMNGRPEEALEQWKNALEQEPDDELLKKKVEYKTFFYE